MEYLLLFAFVWQYHNKKRGLHPPILKNLHWLPVASRIDYKILLLTYCAINNISPAYIQQLITPYVPARKLRSEDCVYSMYHPADSNDLVEGVSVELLQ